LFPFFTQVTPFHAPGSLGAIKEAKSGIFKPAAPFSSLTSIGHNAAIFGSIMGVQRFSSKSLELIRGKEDFYNECFGFGVTYKYYKSFLGSTDGKLLRHNRLIGAAFVGTLLYANLIV